jgi:hypothetical protein
MGAVLSDESLSAEEWESWLRTRPFCIQELCREFPYGTRIMFSDATVYVIGWHEDDAVAVSELNPYQDFDGSRNSKRLLRAQFLRDHGATGKPQ